MKIILDTRYKLFAKNCLPSKIGFFQLLNNLQFVEVDNIDHALTFDGLYWTRNVKEKHIDVVRFAEPPESCSQFFTTL